MTRDSESIEAAATTINWVGYWGQGDYEGKLRGDALAWDGEAVRRFVASSGREVPSEEVCDLEDSPSPFTGAGAAWNSSEVPTPWWVEAQFHTEGPPDDESIPRKLEGWWRVEEYSRDRLKEVGEDLEEGEICYVEKLWTDRIRVFKASEKGPFGIVKLSRVCDLMLTKEKGSHAGSRWSLLRDLGEGGDDPDEIRRGQVRTLLGGEFGQFKLGGMQCKVQDYVEWMDRWTVEIPIRDMKGRNQVIAVVPMQLRPPKLPRDLRPNGHVKLDLSLRNKAIELKFVGEEPTEEEESADLGMTTQSAFLLGALNNLTARPQQPQKQQKDGDGIFRLKLRYVSRVRPGGRVWTSSEESMYKYVEVRFIGSGEYGLVYRVLRMVDNTKQTFEDDEEEDPHIILDVAKGSDRSSIIKAYRKLARRWHPDKVAESEHERAVYEFRRIHQAYENLLADPERSSDLMVLKMQSPFGLQKPGKVTIPQSFHTEVRCLSLVSQLRLPNVQKLVEVGPDNEFVVTWPFIPEALTPNNESDGLNQVDRVDLVRQGWSDYSRSRKSAQKLITTMMSLIRHDVMIVDPVQNIIVERESGEPLFIDFGRGETAGSIYATRIKTFMKKCLGLLVRCIHKSSFDVAARFIRDVENRLFEELEKWQDEKTRDAKKALALQGSTTKWQEGIEQCREIWNSEDENPLRKMFRDQPGIVNPPRRLRDPREDLEEAPNSDDELQVQAKEDEDAEDDDPDGLIDADINSLTPVQRLLRAQRKKNRWAKLPKEKPNMTITINETLPDGSLGLGLDDCDEDQYGIMVVEIAPKAKKYGWEVGDRIIEVNGKQITEWSEFKSALNLAKLCSPDVVFGIVRFGVEPPPPEPKVPKCLHCGSKGKHLQKCTTWKFPLPEDEECAYFCTRECQLEAWREAKRKAAAPPQ
mmetsp:Transcript_15419/g.27587  ORF Transcript_15419/g.27587 Transcript_15419/m.27587 type:complete len:919 (+) Transcript_15419:64-2820(+)